MNETAPTRIGSFFTAPFVAASGLLIAAALLAGPVAEHFQFRQAKRTLKLIKPLSSLNEASLGPYRVVDRQILDPVIVEALGTEDYISWTLEDLSVSRDDPLRYANLLVTYYSGGTNLVPHTPDVCYLGAGYQPAQPHENIDLKVRVPAVGATSVPARLLTFARTAVFDHEKRTVVYTFFCNGRFVNTRTSVRLLINDLSITYAFFSKIEVSFPRATRAQSVGGARKLFAQILPVLVRDHIPDFKKAEARVRASASKG